MMRADLLLKTAKLALTGLAVALLAVAFWLSPTARAAEMTGSGTSCSTGSSNAPPQPYTGGAAVSKVFYPADGSTVTVTSTGAVIKQSPCGTPYREGWVNLADMCCLNTFGDLSGRIKPGSSNPFTNTNSSCSCNTTTTTTTTVNRPTETASATAVAAAETTRPSSSTTSSTSSSPSSSATTSSPATITTAASPKAASLPNTGAGNVLALGGVSTFLGTIGHYLYKTRRTRSYLT